MQIVSNLLLALPICSRQWQTTGDTYDVLTSQRSEMFLSHTHLSFGNTQSPRSLAFKKYISPYVLEQKGKLILL